MKKFIVRLIMKHYNNKWDEWPYFHDYIFRGLFLDWIARDWQEYGWGTTFELIVIPKEKGMLP